MVFIIFGVCNSFLKRRHSFLLYVYNYCAVCRAHRIYRIRNKGEYGTMAFAAGLAGQVGRQYSPRNALSFAALVLTLQNPKVPVFDAGFQLSFLAVLSIVYFKPRS